MNRYLPSEKLSDEYLASERDRLRKFVFSLFENPFEEEIRALEKIEDRYEQLKECVRLQDKMQEYVLSEEYPKKIALQFLTIAKFDKDAFNRYFEEHSEYTVITLYELAKEFFESIEKNARGWRSGHFQNISAKTISEIVKISVGFFDTYPQWVKNVIRIGASTLSLQDKFMQYTPKNKFQKILMQNLTTVIQNGIGDFYCVRIGPSLDRKGNIWFTGSGYSARGKSYIWWQENAEMFSPACKSRLGTRAEYIAFIGVMMKTLIEEGWSVKSVWNAVCNDSRMLSSYWHSKSMTSYVFDTFYYTRKILADDIDGKCFWCTESWISYNSSLIDIQRYYGLNTPFDSGVGWIVFPTYVKAEVPTNHSHAI